MQSIEMFGLVAGVFLFAGWVKGVVGMGLPTVAMGLLALSMPPGQAAALLVVPSLVTNAWQFAVGPAAAVVLKRLWPMMVFVCFGTVLGIGFLTGANARWPALALGAVLAAYALVGLLLPRLQVPAHRERLLAPVIGAATGVLTGATGVFVVPAVPYISALGLGKDALIQALGLSFTVSTLALAVGLGATGAFSRELAIGSVAAVVPSVLGMYLGQLVRDKLDPHSFRRWFFGSMLLVGLFMVARAL
jgi:uncharacterized protein